MNNTLISGNVLACPLDGSALLFHPADGQQRGRLGCSHGHHFDVARQGYVNLLAVQDKRSRDPGDGKAMVAARHRLLESGLYAGIATALEQQVLQVATRLGYGNSQRELFVLDAGCGEGYYLERCLAALGSAGAVCGIGVDISKWAIQSAARRHGDALWLVASNRNLPLQPGTMDVIVCGFGFPDFAAFRRVLKPKGVVIMLDPGPDHLVELRRLIYPSIREYRENTFEAAMAQGFDPVARASHTECRTVLSGQVGDILVMSPHFYRATAEGRSAALSQASLDMTLDIRLTVLGMA